MLGPLLSSISLLKNVYGISLGNSDSITRKQLPALPDAESIAGNGVLESQPPSREKRSQKSRLSQPKNLRKPVAHPVSLSLVPHIR